MAKRGLYANINRRKRLGISRPKSKSTISAKAYANMKANFIFHDEIVPILKKVINKISGAS